MMKPLPPPPKEPKKPPRVVFRIYNLCFTYILVAPLSPVADVGVEA